MKKTIKNTLSGYDYRYGRRQGNSTRQIDLAIHYLFNEFKIEVRDHYQNGTHDEANKNLFERILKRLNLEHGLNNLIRNDLIIIDQLHLTIELKDESNNN